jgi:hypothetical protein
MGTAANRAAASTKYFSRGDYIPGLRVNAMDVLAVRQACGIAKNWTSEGNGPLVMEFVTCKRSALYWKDTFTIVSYALSDVLFFVFVESKKTVMVVTPCPTLVLLTGMLSVANILVESTLLSYF